MPNRRDAEAATAVQAMAPADRVHALGRLEGELYCSANGVTQQARRLRESLQPGPEFMADGRLLAYLLRDAIRIAETCRLLVDSDMEAAIDEALARVFDACPDAIDARDALEHCDDYVIGIGRQQRKRPGDYSQRYARGGPMLMVVVGDLTIDVDLAERSANHLAAVVLSGTDHLNLLP